MKFTEDPQTNNSSGLFIKLKDGESIQCVLRGEPNVFYVQWDNGKSSECTKGAKGAKFRFRINAIVNEEKKYVAKILEQGAMVYSDLKALNEEYPLEETLVKITRHGLGTDTTYSVMPTRQQPDDKSLKLINAVELHSLESKKDVQDDTPNFDEAENIPF